MTTDRTMTVRDGRTIAWTESGVADGLPLLRIPGTPGCRWNLRADQTPWLDRGLRAITTERPGYGASTRLPGRGFREHADDLAELLDHLGLEQVVVTGGSGASPHILALAQRHPDRVSAATVTAGAAPLQAEELAHLVDINVKAYWLGQERDWDGMAALLVPIREAFLADPLAGMRAVLENVPAEDHAVMSDPAWQELFVRSIREALSQGCEGWIDESMALETRWGDIDATAIQTSITWWHSRVDHNAPLAAAERLVAQLPNATLRVWDDPGHLAAYHREGEILDELLARGRR